MTPTMPANSFFDRVREWESFAEGGGFPHFCYQARDSTRGGFLSPLAEQPRQLFFAVLDYNSCGSELGPWIHAHVEGTVAQQAETALCIFELPGRDAKIEKRAADDADPKVVENFRRVSKIRLSHGEARTEPRQLLAQMLDRVGILIQGQNVGPRFHRCKFQISKRPRPPIRATSPFSPILLQSSSGKTRRPCRSAAPCCARECNCRKKTRRSRAETASFDSAAELMRANSSGDITRTN